MPIFAKCRCIARVPASRPTFPESCLPTGAKAPPSGPDWIHEIKHDGFRVLAQRAGSKVQLISRNGHDLTYRFPLVAAAMAQLPVTSCLIDGEAILCDDNVAKSQRAPKNITRLSGDPDKGD